MIDSFKHSNVIYFSSYKAFYLQSSHLRTKACLSNDAFSEGERPYELKYILLGCLKFSIISKSYPIRRAQEEDTKM